MIEDGKRLQPIAGRKTSSNRNRIAVAIMPPTTEETTSQATVCS
jgi:hypothetical protein